MQSQRGLQREDDKRRRRRALLLALASSALLSLIFLLLVWSPLPKPPEATGYLLLELGSGAETAGQEKPPVAAKPQPAKPPAEASPPKPEPKPEPKPKPQPAKPAAAAKPQSQKPPATAPTAAKPKPVKPSPEPAAPQQAVPKPAPQAKPPKVQAAPEASPPAQPAKPAASNETPAAPPVPEPAATSPKPPAPAISPPSQEANTPEPLKPGTVKPSESRPQTVAAPPSASSPKPAATPGPPSPAASPQIGPPAEPAPSPAGQTQPSAPPPGAAATTGPPQPPAPAPAPPAPAPPSIAPAPPAPGMPLAGGEPSPAPPSPAVSPQHGKEQGGAIGPGEKPYKLRRLRPLLVAIDNARAAFPQWGLEWAVQIHEVPMEGGVTRLLVRYEGGEKGKIGPVRSARPYILQLASSMGAVLLHVGGSPAALAMIEKQSLATFDGLYDPLFKRDPARRPPHNTYVLGPVVRKQLNRLRLENARTISGKAYRPAADAAAGERLEARYAPDYASAFHYDGKGYVWFRNGRRTRVRVTAVVALQVEAKVIDDVGRLQLALSSGKGALYIEGKRVPITWRFKGGLHLYDQHDNLIDLTPYKTWFLWVPPWGRVL